MASIQPETQGAGSAENQAAPIPIENMEKIQELLRTKNDTSRFVGLALLKSVLDNSPSLRDDKDAITALWQSVSPKFLDRLLRSGSAHGRGDGQGDGQGKGPSRRDAQDMVEIAVAVLHTFTLLLPEGAKRSARLVGRIPGLLSVILQSPDAVIQPILETVLTLVSYPEGAQEFAAVDDISSLIEVAPSQPLALDVLLFSWVNLATATEDKLPLSVKIDQTIQGLVASFKATDAVTLLVFLDELLRRLNPESIPQDPPWMKSIVALVRNLVASRPTRDGRTAYTNLAASLLQAYPTKAPRLLFSSDDANSEKPFSYLLINLLLVDLQSSFPTLLEQLNSPGYEETSRRLASAFDVVSSFVGFLVRFLDDEDGDDSSPSSARPLSGFVMTPDLLLKLRRAISETMSMTIEYLRDRWDASVAGAMGLHPGARAGTAKTSAGTHLTIAWDSKKDDAGQDALILAAVRALAIWLREDDNDALRKEAAGLCDMLVDLYRGSTAGQPDFRRPILVALEGITSLDDGIQALLEQDGWQVLAGDMLHILRSNASASASASDESEAERGTEVVRILLPVVEKESPGTREEWMAVVTAVAAWEAPPAEQAAAAVYEFQVAALQLVTALLAGAHSGMQRRYVYSTSAVLGISRRLRGKIKGDAALVEALEDVEATLDPLR